MVDVLLQMTHEKQITRLEPVVVQCMMVDVRKDCTRTQSVSVVLCVDESAQFLHNIDTGDGVLIDFVVLLLQHVRIEFVVQVVDLAQVHAADFCFAANAFNVLQHLLNNGCHSHFILQPVNWTTTSDARMNFDSKIYNSATKDRRFLAPKITSD